MAPPPRRRSSNSSDGKARRDSVTPFSQHVGSKQTEPPFKTSGSSGSLGAGVVLSVGLHALLVTFIVFGLPIFWDPEPLPAIIGIELAQQADITASNARIQGPVKPAEAPKPVEAKKEPPKKETTPPPAPKVQAAPPPPPPEEEVAEALPDPAIQKQKEAEEKKKAEEQKKKDEEEKKRKRQEEEKKRKDEAKKKQKEEEQDFNKMMESVLPADAAPEPKEKPAKKPEPLAQEAATGEVTPEYSAVPLNAGEENGIRAAVEKNWIVPLGLPDIYKYTIQLRLHMNRNGTVAKIDVLSPVNDNVSRTIADSAMRAINKTVQQEGRLPVPEDKYNSTIVLRWNMELVCAQLGC
jgi:hypothetical protein